MAVDPAEIRLNLFLVDMHRRRNDVAWRLVAQLNDIFAQIGFDGFNTIAFQVLIDRDFLGDHRLALGDGFGIGALADIEDDIAGILGTCRPVDTAATVLNLGLIGLQIMIQMAEHMVFDVSRAVAQRFKFRQIGRSLGAFVDKAALNIAQRLLQVRVFQRFGGFFLKIG